MPEEETAIITTDTCPHCATMKKYLKDSGLMDKVKVINASTPEGLEFAMKHGIKAVPECVVIRKNGEEVRVCTQDEFMKVLEGKNRAKSEKTHNP
jgi:predicted thioredoxin/glutaredoxin